MFLAGSFLGILGACLPCSCGPRIMSKPRAGLGVVTWETPLNPANQARFGLRWAVVTQCSQVPGDLELPPTPLPQLPSQPPPEQAGPAPSGPGASWLLLPAQEGCWGPPDPHLLTASSGPHGKDECFGYSSTQENGTIGDEKCVPCQFPLSVIHGFHNGVGIKVHVCFVYPLP